MRETRGAVRRAPRVAERLLERAEQVGLLAGWSGEAVHAGRMVLVAGEAGVGKTTVVNDFLGGLTSRTPVLRGWCESLSTPRPLAALLDVAAQTGGKLAAAVSADPRPPDVIGVLLTTLARWPGTVLVIEDLHWADDATLDLVRLISRRIGDVPALVVVTYRDDEVGAVHPLRMLLGDLGTRPAVRRLSLAPLTEGAVAELATDTDVDAGELFRLTGGNPFYVTEVLNAGAAGVPVTVRDAVLARVARLSASARRALEAAATIGTPLDLGLLRAVAGTDAAGLDECAEAGVLRADGDRVAFRHELARRAVEESMAPARRALLHAEILGRLAGESDVPAARLAHHAAAAGDQDAVGRYAEQAARHAARLGAHREAAAQYRRVLAVLDPGAATPERARLLLSLSLECSLSDQLAEATASAEEALRIWQAAGDRQREGDTVRCLARLAWMSERGRDALRLSHRAVEVLKPVPAGVELARAYAQCARVGNNLNLIADAATWAQRALDLCDRLGEPGIAAEATIDLGLARALRDETDQGAVALIEAGVTRAHDLGLDEHAARGLFALGRVAWQHRRLPQADQRLRAAEQYCHGRGVEFFEDYSLAFHAAVLLDLGDWSQAEALAMQVWQRTVPSSSGNRTAMVCAVLGRLNAWRGTTDSTDYFASGEAVDRGRFISGWGLGVVAGRAEEAWLNGRLSDEIDPLLEAAERLQADEVARWQQAEVCWWLRAAGVEVEVKGAGPFTAQAAGDWRAAADGWQALGMPYHRAVALAQADEEPALREGLDICRDLGAVPLARRIAQRLRGLGVRDLPRLAGSSAPGTPGLITPREHEVLVLLADGLRDADIAERLTISLRTVHHHVASLRAKLDAPSRTGAVAAATRQGLLTIRDGDT